MKKYITIAALLAAGSTLASATEEILTLTSPSGGALSSSNQALDWSQSYTELKSWELSFTLTDATLKEGEDYSVLFGTRQSGGVAGFSLRVNSNGSLEVYTYKTNTSGFSDTTVLTSGVWITAGDPTDVSLRFIADVDDTNQILGGTFTLSSGSDKSVSQKLEDNFAPVLGQTSLKKGSVSRLYTNGGQETFANITVKKLDNHVIPEPSAFGLLAGLGALTLVGTRRRRRN